MKTTIYLCLLFLGISNVYAQPNFTYADMPNIGDHDSLNHNPNYTHSGNLDTETGNNYTWDFSTLSFSNIFWAVDSVRVKTHPVSSSFTDATIEYFHQEASGNNLDLFSYSGDTLYIHRTGSTTGGTAFLPPVASIRFPITFNTTSEITEALYFGSTQIGERSTNILYDGFGTLNLPNGENHQNVFRIKSIVTDSTFSTGFTITYTNYFWYLQGGDIPLLRIFKTDFNGSSGSIYNVYTRKNPPTTVSLNKVIPNSNYSLYPNPTSDFLQLHGIGYTQSYKILDIKGKEWKNGSITENQKINLQALPIGLYFLKIDKNEAIPFIKN